MTTLEELKTLPKLDAIIEKQGPLFDLIIIGGGPAGLTAALYAGRARLKTLIIERALLGGMASTAFHIDNYPGFPRGVSGMDISRYFEEQAKKFGADFYYGEVLGIKRKELYYEVKIDKKDISTKTIIIAAGSESKKLNIKGENEFRGKGVSYCATCDGPFYKDKSIAVIGGGNSAVEEALYLTRYASKISIIHRRDKLRADKILAEQALNDPKIFILWNSQIEEILGAARVENIKIKNTITKKSSRFPIDGVFVYVGSNPNSKLFSNLVKLDKNGYILTNEEMKTAASGIFAAGDIRKKTLRQIVTAASDGAIAANSARIYIDSNLK
ncbi:MAG: thioredoxin reductase (NADPH) [Candidatus Saganbacteria bacterium]|uniref:Thioredoxin reductase n=1 Tax=Candidatus Saganbacteria bacterium TaxID=2575572 RepID=A0A833KZM9_UNCSA|nr:MAG: thioredoxin reductase (NADPH) [Candidatus Saganbacteria bacterium]